MEFFNTCGCFTLLVDGGYFGGVCGSGLRQWQGYGSFAVAEAV
jgi:hypothetical protein